jgi:hypothetical protein
MLKNIGKTRFFIQLDEYPQTVSDLKTMIDIVDVAELFKNYNLAVTKTFSPTRLDVTYVVLLLGNQIYTKFIHHVSQNVIVAKLRSIIKCSSLTWYDLFFDQLSQDIEPYLKEMISSMRSTTDNSTKSVVSFTCYFVSLMKNDIYRTSSKKLKQKFGKSFVKRNANVFNQIEIDLEACIINDLSESIETLEMFVSDVFNQSVNDDIVNNILNRISSNINLETLVTVKSLEMEIYMEQRLADKIHLSETSDTVLTSDSVLTSDTTSVITSTISDMSKEDDIRNIHNKANSMGWRIVNIDSESNMLAPFVDHRLMPDVISGHRVLLEMLDKYPEFVPANQYRVHLPKDNISLDDFTVNEIMQFIVRVYQIKIELITESQTTVYSYKDAGKTVHILAIDDKYHTVTPINQRFVPINKLIKKIDNTKNKNLIKKLQNKMKENL